MTQGICLIFRRVVERLEFWTLMGFFCPKHIKIWMKKYRRVVSHDTEEWCKVRRKTESWLHKWHEEFGEFSPNHSKVQTFYFDGLFLAKVYEVWAKKIQRRELKKIQRRYRSWQRTVMQNLNKLWPCGFKNGMRNWVNFHKTEKLYIDELFLSKAYNISVRKFHRKYVSWHWRVVQNLKENWLVAWKMT